MTATIPEVGCNRQAQRPDMGLTDSPIDDELNVIALRKLREMRLGRGWTRQRAADETKISFGMYHKLERGERRLSVRVLGRLAKGFGVHPDEFFVADSGSETLTAKGVNGDLFNNWRVDDKTLQLARAFIEASKLTTVPVHGVAHDLEGAVAWAHASGVAPAPIGATATTAAIEIRGGVLRGMATEGWMLYFDDLRQPVDEATIGELSVVATASGEVFIRTPRPGSRPGRFHLESAGAPPLYDVDVAWAAIVTSIIPGKIAQRMLAGETFQTRSAPFKSSRPRKKK